MRRSLTTLALKSASSRYGLVTRQEIRVAKRWNSQKARTDAQIFLASKGYSDDVITGIMKAFPAGSQVSVNELKSFGDGGLEALAQAVQRELQQQPQPKNEVTVNIKMAIPHEKRTVSIKAKSGESLYDLAQRDESVHAYLECACSGIAACSTCHVIIRDAEMFKKLPPPEEAELDMLDLAWGVTDQSRLGCQIKLQPELEGLEFEIPAQTNNLYSRAL